MVVLSTELEMAAVLVVILRPGIALEPLPNFAANSSLGTLIRSVIAHVCCTPRIYKVSLVIVFVLSSFFPRLSRNSLCLPFQNVHQAYKAGYSQLRLLPARKTHFPQSARARRSFGFCHYPQYSNWCCHWLNQCKRWWNSKRYLDIGCNWLVCQTPFSFSPAYDVHRTTFTLELAGPLLNNEIALANNIPTSNGVVTFTLPIVNTGYVIHAQSICAM